MRRELGREKTHIENIAKGDPFLIFMPHMLDEHEQRYRLVAEILKETGVAGKPTIVDLGSGRDLGANILAEEMGGAKVVGLEKDKQYIQRTMKNKQNAVLHAQADSRQIPLANNCADAVAIIEMLEHVPKDDQPKLLKEDSNIYFEKTGAKINQFGLGRFQALDRKNQPETGGKHSIYP